MLTGKHPTSPVPALAPFENPTHVFSRVSFRSVSEGLPRLLPALRRPPQLHGAWVLVLPLPPGHMEAYGSSQHKLVSIQPSQEHLHLPRVEILLYKATYLSSFKTLPKRTSFVKRHSGRGISSGLRETWV